MIPPIKRSIWQSSTKHFRRQSTALLEVAKARLGDGIHGEVLSPASQREQYTVHFYDLDTGYQPKWPAHIPQDEAQIDQKQLANWAMEKGVDLMCVTHRAPDGTQTYVLRAFNMEAWEINQRDLRNIDRLTDTLPQGRPVGELLMHYDSESRQLVPDANAAFIFVTREGSMGVIETTDRVTLRTANLGVGSPGPAARPRVPQGRSIQRKAYYPEKLQNGAREDGAMPLLKTVGGKDAV